MAEALILDNFRTAYHILVRNVNRTLHTQAGVDTKLSLQAAEVLQFVRAVEPHQAVFTPEEYAVVVQSTTNMVNALNNAHLPRPSDPTETPLPQRAPSEMHRSLRIPEIAQLIVSHIDPSFVTGADAALASLARTSRIFHDHALDLLWRQQDTIGNLVKCMPDDLWEVQIINRRRTMCLRRPLADADWERPLHYSHRVRSLSIKPSYNDDCGFSNVYKAIQGSFPGIYLLPNLQTIRWHDPARLVDFSHVHLFLGPRITSVRFGGLFPNEQQSLLPTLTDRFPSLTDVSIRPDFPPNSESLTRISAFIRGLQNVKVLEASFLDLPALAHLGQLQSLETLNLSEFTTTSFTALNGRDLFPKLRSVSLNLGSGKIESATGFISTWATPPVRDLDVRILRCPTADAAERLYRALLVHCSHESLEILKVDIMYSPPENAERDNYVLPGDALKPLLHFTNLVNVRIVAPSGYILDDTMVSEMAHAWPFVEELRLKAREHKDLPRGTLAALHTLAQHCSHLHTLEITIDARAVPEQPRELHARQQLLHPNLVTLDVAHSPISAPFDVARYLSATFFNLAEILTAREDEDNDDEEELEEHRVEIGYHVAWKEVLTFLPGLNDIRAEEYDYGVRSIGLAEYLPYDLVPA
ncbi:hypothetical protein B0H11DRAFT_1872722 [Mycena galericulata]|nr:hypothetical protein B0H11DRAFT_1872722 [Mycena galericulata]